MNTSTHPSWIDSLDLNERRPPEFFRTLEEVQNQAPPLYAHTMRRAWESLSLCGILCLDDKPIAYFKDYATDSIDPAAMREAHCQLWNQGTAPLLVASSRTEIQVYSGLAPPAKSDEDVTLNGRRAEVFERTAIALRYLVPSIQTGEFFRKHPASFNPKNRVDRFLLNQLNATRKRLVDKTEGDLDTKTAHALLGRTVFTCYLIDREVIVPAYFDAIGLKGVRFLQDILNQEDSETAKQSLYTLFEKLKSDFNGDLFDIDLHAESQRIEAVHIDLLRAFLRGDKMFEKQASFGFFPYDFGIIPIELISSIYESFLEAEDAKEKREAGAYYTPRFVAELVLSTALDNMTSLLDKRFLDPACGSGIFLVGLFNRLAEEWLRLNPNTKNEERYDAFVTMLQDNIFGIDESETACRIAAFSLYLALLDQLDPRDIGELQAKGKTLPKLVLNKIPSSEEETGRTILCRNFFSRSLFEDLPLPDKGFDVVIGNPPWSNKPNSETEKWCIEEGLPTAQGQLAYGFMWKSPRHLRDRGNVCFLLPTSILLNQQKKALDCQRYWLEEFGVDLFINLADMSFLLFDKPDRPAFIARYRKETPDKVFHYIEYFTPKTELATLHAGILTLSVQDRSEIRLREPLCDLRDGKVPTIWKQSLWGTPRDIKLLDRLSLFSSLEEIVGKTKDKKRWLIGRGFQPKDDGDNLGKLKNRPFSKSHFFLDAQSASIKLILSDTDCTPLGERFKKLFRLPDERIFQCPHVVVKQGSRKGLKVAFADFDVVFRDAIYGINGPEQDEELLMFLAGVLDSKLALYYLFHTVANWGTERDKVHEGELLRMPFPLSDTMDSPTAAHGIVREVANLMRNAIADLRGSVLGHDFVIDDTRQQILPLVYRYYGISDLEQKLIEDTVNLWEPSSTPSSDAAVIPALKPSDKTTREKYTTLLCETLNTWARSSGFSIQGSSIISEEVGVGILILTRQTGEGQGSILPEEQSSERLTEAIRKLWKEIPARQGNISRIRAFKMFVGNELYIFKPLAQRYWAETYALNDADEIAAAVLRTVGSKK